MVMLDKIDSKKIGLDIQPLRYKQEHIEIISDIVCYELPCHYAYSCQKYEKEIDFLHTWEAEKKLYAYPDKLEELILGHTVLDCLPCYNDDFSYSIIKESEKYILKLEAREKAESTSNLFTQPPLQIEEIPKIMDNFLSIKGKWEGSGSFHRAGLYHSQTKEFILAEDIGRHNCVDRLKGHALMNKLDLSDYFLFITARITASLYLKIRRAGIKNIVSRSAITSTPYNLALDDSVTLAAFCRPHDDRVTLFHNGQKSIIA